MNGSLITHYCVCGKGLYHNCKSDLCFWCKRTFLFGLGKNLNLKVTIIK